MELLLVVSLLAGATGTDVPRERLDVLTRAELTAGPWTITSAPPPMDGVARNDYYSEAPYWWPDPKNPKAPFLRRDGETYPQRFDKHRRMLGQVSDALLALGLRAALLEDKAAAKRGELIARQWFLDPATRMNPNLEYGQAIRNRNSGRGAGIIDTRSLIWAVEGLRRLEQAGSFSPEERAGLRRWFSDYAGWMRTSEKGATEGKAKNNHGTWWAAQMLAYTGYAGERAPRDEVYRQVKARMIPGQIRADGSCPEEEARTRSLSYSAMNLDGWAVLATLAGRDGVDLWEVRNGGSGSIRDAVRYLTPYLAAPKSWKKKQITPFDPAKVMFAPLDRAARGEKLGAILREIL